MLFHFSEESDIELFVPRTYESRPDLRPVVWAMNGERQVNYFFPRQCPRIIYRKNAHVSPEDQKLFFAHTYADTVITVEKSWYEQIRTTTLFKYSFERDGFESIDGTAGYYVSYRTVKPVSIEPMENLMNQLINSGADLRFTSNLYPLRDAILNSSVEDFSMIRMRNAIK